MRCRLTVMPYSSAVRTSRIRRAALARTRVGTQPEFDAGAARAVGLQDDDPRTQLGRPQRCGSAGRPCPDHGDVVRVGGPHTHLLLPSSTSTSLASVSPTSVRPPAAVRPGTGNGPAPQGCRAVRC
jgi:hypothetical protein